MLPSSVLNTVLSVAPHRVWSTHLCSQRSLKTFSTLDEFTYSLSSNRSQWPIQGNIQYSALFIQAWMARLHKICPELTCFLSSILSSSFFYHYLVLLTKLFYINFQLSFGLFDTDDHETHNVHTRTNTGDLWRLVCFCAQTQCKKNNVNLFVWPTVISVWAFNR